jgi:predicted nucleic acid-binding protein
MNNLLSVVSDTSPLISLEKLENGYQFIKQLYGQIFVPKIVIEELYQGEFLNWHDYQCFYCIGDGFTIVDQELEILPILEGLDAGEQQAIQLAYNLQLPLLIEEEKGRKIAQELGIKFSGIAGQILKANRENLMTAEDSRKKLGELLKAGRIGKKMYNELVNIIL